MALREVLVEFTTKFATGPLKAGLGMIKRGISAVANFRNLLLGSALFLGAKRVGDAMAEWVKDLVSEGDKLAKTAKQLGIPPETLQSWQVAGQFAGASAEDVTNAFTKIQKAAADAGDGLKAAADGFRAAGVDFKAADGSLKDGPQLMRELADGLRGVTDTSKRTQIAMALMGRSGSKLIPLLTQDAEALDASLRELAELGGGFSADMAKSSEDAADAMLRWELATKSMKTQVVAGILPTITTWLNRLSKFGGKLASLVKDTEAGKTAFLIFGGTVAAVMAAVLLPLLPIIAAFAIFFLIVEDLVTMFSGGKSVVGAFLDKTFGVGTTAKVVEKAKKAWEKYKDQIVSTGKQVAIFIVKATVGIIAGTIKMIAAFLNFKNAVGFYIDDIKTRFSSLVNAIKAIPRNVQMIGEDIMQGLIDGIEKKWDSLVKKVKQVGQIIEKTLRVETETRSPSRKAMRIAADYGEGLIQGLQRSAPGLKAAAANLAPEASLPSTAGASVPNRGPVTVAVTQSNHMTFNGMDPAKTASAVRKSAVDGLAAERRAALQAFTPYVEA